jgi:hypothetical protein
MVYWIGIKSVVSSALHIGIKCEIKITFDWYKM